MTLMDFCQTGGNSFSHEPSVFTVHANASAHRGSGHSVRTSELHESGFHSVKIYE